MEAGTTAGQVRRDHGPKGFFASGDGKARARMRRENGALRRHGRAMCTVQDRPNAQGITAKLALMPGPAQPE